ncbi:MAG: magnesium transporter [Bacteroidales bacterium OttesenSCG-928-I14]|jgi:magnesium transporter|nr:magnesium transporter [Bacteroidales bacterium OttesenSCG-928-I14]
MKELGMYFFKLIRAKNWKTIKLEINKIEPIQIAEVIEELKQTDRIIIFRILTRDLSKEVFKHLSHKQQEDIIQKLIANTYKITNLLNDIEPDDRTAFFEELPGEISWRLIKMLSSKERNIATRLLGYPEESIGRLMTPRYIAIELHCTVQDTLDYIRHFGKNFETLDIIYVVDEQHHLIDDIQIKDIILAQTDEIIVNLTDNRFISLSAYDDQEKAIQIFKNYDRTALPVVDTNNILLGIVTVDDVMDIAEEENTEDFQKFGGVLELNLSYTKVPLQELIKKRAGWLIILFFSEMLTAGVMSFFETTMAKTVSLTLFLPLIISSGGNSGSQAASLIIRALALEELNIKNWWYVMKKEILSGLLLGIILGLVGFTRVVIWQKIGFYNYGENWILLALSIGLSLTFIVLWGTLSGSMIPLVLKRCGLDPATASAPFVATLVDVTGLIIHFSLATMIL